MTRGIALGVPKRIHCEPPKVDKVQTVQVELFVPRTNPLTAEAHKCWSRTRTTCTHVGFFGSKGIVSQTTKVEPVTAQDCHAAVQNKRWHGRQMKLVSQGFWSTNLPDKVDFRWCCKDTCTSITNWFLAKGSIASTDGTHLISDLGDMGHCKADAGICRKNGDVVVWNKRKFWHFCPFVSHGIHNATYSYKSHILIEDLQGAFSFLKQGVYKGESIIVHPPCLDDPKIHLMEQGVAVRILGHFGNLFDQWSSNNKSTSSTSEMIEEDDPVNAKLEFLKEKLLENEQRGFRQVWTALCRIAQRQLDMVHQLLALDATLGARALLQRTDITAAFAGEALIVSTCQIVTPQAIYWNYSYNGECYQRLPVVFKNTTYFVLQLPLRNRHLGRLFFDPSGCFGHTESWELKRSS
ncbi:MAG: hypothetical protein GY820_06790 [Gammaproteobacteria bacterium]|nr:hypothetical protein [Gammaproteobacteria bacterium]